MSSSSSMRGKLQIFSWEAEQGLLAGMEQGGLIQKADTLEELAEKLNMPADAFVATVERYNELCAKGEDEDFGKESLCPPYCCRQRRCVHGRSAHQHQDAGAGYRMRACTLQVTAAAASLLT